MGPKDATNKDIKSPPGNWIKSWSKSKPGKCYYFNDKTGESTWIRPSGTVIETCSNSSSREAQGPVKRRSDPDIAPNQKKSKTHDVAYKDNEIDHIKPATVLQNSCNSKLDSSVSRPTVKQRSEEECTSKPPHLVNVDGSHHEQKKISYPPPELQNKNGLEEKSLFSNILLRPSISKKRRKPRKTRKQKIPTDLHCPHLPNLVSAPSNNTETFDGCESTSPCVFKDSNSCNGAIRACTAVIPVISSKKSGESQDNFKESILPNPTKCGRSVDLSTACNATSQKVSVTTPSPYHKLNISKCVKSPLGAVIKGTAQKRLKRLQESLHNKQESIVLKNDLIHSKNTEKLAIDEHFSERVDSNISPAGKRLAEFQRNLKSKEIRNEKSLPSVTYCLPQGRDISVQLPINVDDSEAMEVEYMESEVLCDIGELRQKDGCLELNQSIFMDVDMDCSVNESDPNSILYIVLDTNILLSHLKFTADLRDSILPGKGPVHLYLPWQVLHELDHLKDKGKSSIQPLARRAINYLHDNFASKHPRLRGQKLSEAIQNSSNCADDNILQACLLLKDQGCDVILLSNDKNLCNKALVCDVSAVSKDQFYEKMYLGRKVISTKDDNSVQQNGFIKNDITTHSSLHDIILSELKSIIKETLTEIVSRGMEDEYKHFWKKCTVLAPPWETDNVLHCLSHHWLPICGDFTPPLVQDSIKELRQLLKSMAKCKCPNALHINESLVLSKAIFGAINKKYKDIVDIAIHKIKELEINLSNGDTVAIGHNFSSTWTADEMDKRVCLVLTCFEEAHNAAQSICSVQSLATPDLMQKAACMLEAVRSLMHLLKLLLAIPVHSLNEENLVVNELVCLIKGMSSITPSDFVCFFKKDGMRSLIENGIVQFASFEVQLTKMLEMTS